MSMLLIYLILILISIRYADLVSVNDEVLVTVKDKLLPDTVVDVSLGTRQGKVCRKATISC